MAVCQQDEQRIAVTIMAALAGCRNNPFNFIRNQVLQRTQLSILLTVTKRL